MHIIFLLKILQTWKSIGFISWKPSRIITFCHFKTNSDVGLTICISVTVYKWYDYVKPQVHLGDVMWPCPLTYIIEYVYIYKKYGLASSKKTCASDMIITDIGSFLAIPGILCLRSQPVETYQSAYNKCHSCSGKIVWYTYNVRFGIWFDLSYSFFIQGIFFSVEYWSPGGPCIK